MFNFTVQLAANQHGEARKVEPQQQHRRAGERAVGRGAPEAKSVKDGRIPCMGRTDRLGEALAYFWAKEIVMLQRWVIGFTAVWLGIAAVASAQDRVTVQMRDGSKVEGRIDGLDPEGELVIRVTQDDQRRLPLGSVALIDKVGGARGLPETEIREATGAQHLLLLTNGTSVKGHLVAIRGGEGSGHADQPRTFVFRAEGRDQSFGPNEVARIYLGAYPFATSMGSATAPGNTTSDLDQGVDHPGAVRVGANSGWVSTGLRVRRGELVSFNTSGEVQLSDNRNDRARAAGTGRLAPGSPLPSVNAGALIGRVGNSQPFGIGDQTSVPMPFDGVLDLAVNDDERADNVGAFIVSINRLRR